MLDSLVTWVEVDLDAIAHNVRSLVQYVGERVEVIAVVKANAYGHGAVPVARAALEAGATRLAVHRLVEGVELRQAGLEAPILVMGYNPPFAAPTIARWRLTPSLMTNDLAQALAAEAVALGMIMPVHIKVDTGMSRYGLMPEEVLDLLCLVQQLPSLRLEGLFTHFATADAADETNIRRQLAVLNDVVTAAQAAGFTIPVVHAANSAATMRFPEAHFNAVRPGVAMYGLIPSEECPPAFDLRPALALKSRICRVRTLSPGAGVSYGRTYVAGRPVCAALVPVGYGDGYHRSLSNKGSVLIGGQRAPILGRVCMDQFVVDVTHIPGVRQGDEVVLIGRQGSEQISAEEVARLAATINYEVTTSLQRRAVRVYYRNGAVVATDPALDWTDVHLTAQAEM